eukprot:4767291-Prymnesium_polylepis.1
MQNAISKGPLVEAIRAAGAWVRDLTGEGIEPNPVPRYISKNVNGMTGLANALKIFMRIVKSHQQKPITAQRAVLEEELSLGDRAQTRVSELEEELWDTQQALGAAEARLKGRSIGACPWCPGRGSS